MRWDCTKGIFPRQRSKKEINKSLQYNRAKLHKCFVIQTTHKRNNLKNCLVLLILFFSSLQSVYSLCATSK
ncbi:hypothetical protein VIGAN_04345700 [Vigna angularis var. angularis]|uniref:Uncharacterized protein n=1 Tax=Vigna angularis var. angularis TaxID=157739 RepID=A0A0S3RZ51_PHAAN|nr:hypothetical protein VIGAN_04345700 [Vigna angularis var. angularis]